MEENRLVIIINSFLQLTIYIWVTNVSNKKKKTKNKLTTWRHWLVNVKPKKLTIALVLMNSSKINHCWRQLLLISNFFAAVVLNGDKYSSSVNSFVASKRARVYYPFFLSYLINRIINASWVMLGYSHTFLMEQCCTINHFLSLSLSFFGKCKTWIIEMEKPQAPIAIQFFSHSPL